MTEETFEESVTRYKKSMENTPGQIQFINGCFVYELIRRYQRLKDGLPETENEPLRINSYD